MSTVWLPVLLTIGTGAIGIDEPTVVTMMADPIAVMSVSVVGIESIYIVVAS